MRIYFICPRRPSVPTLITTVDSIIDSLEELGHTVYYTPRDARNSNGAGLHVCTIKREVMAKADKVFFAWDGEDQDCVFDLGMAFAMSKKVILISGCVPSEIEIPSLFTSAISEWADVGPEKFSTSKEETNG
jgi:hypothetical protein